MYRPAQLNQTALSFDASLVSRSLMSSHPFYSSPTKQSVVRSLKQAWNTVTKKSLLDEQQNDPFASTWFLVDEEALERERNGFVETRESPTIAPSLDSFFNFEDTTSHHPSPSPKENQNPDKLTSFLPSFDSPPSSPKLPPSRELQIHPFDDDQTSYFTPEVEYPDRRLSSESFMLDLLENASDYSSFSSSDVSASDPSLGRSTPSVTKNERTYRTHPSIDVRMISDGAPASLRCWRPLSWSGLLGVVSLRTNRPKDELAFVCKNYPNVISSAEEYDAMLAWFYASKNGPCPKVDLWVVNKTLTSGRMHLGRSNLSPQSQSSSEFSSAPPPSKQLRRAATTLLSSPKISQVPPLSWKFGMGSMECPEFNPANNNKLRGWI